ncbi:unnamed protein product [Chrysoparadoxa australica]
MLNPSHSEWKQQFWWSMLAAVSSLVTLTLSFWDCTGSHFDCIVGDLAKVHYPCKKHRFHYFSPVFSGSALFTYTCMWTRFNATLGGSVLHPVGGGYMIRSLSCPPVLASVIVSSCFSVWLYKALIIAAGICLADSAALHATSLPSPAPPSHQRYPTCSTQAPALTPFPPHSMRSPQPSHSPNYPAAPSYNAENMLQGTSTTPGQAFFPSFQSQSDLPQSGTGGRLSLSLSPTPSQPLCRRAGPGPGPTSVESVLRSQLERSSGQGSQSTSPGSYTRRGTRHPKNISHLISRDSDSSGDNRSGRSNRFDARSEKSNDDRRNRGGERFDMRTGKGDNERFDSRPSTNRLSNRYSANAERVGSGGNGGWSRCERYGTRSARRHEGSVAGSMALSSHRSMFESPASLRALSITSSSSNSNSSSCSEADSCSDSNSEEANTRAAGSPADYGPAPGPTVYRRRVGARATPPSVLPPPSASICMASKPSGDTAWSALFPGSNGEMHHCNKQTGGDSRLVHPGMLHNPMQAPVAETPGPPPGTPYSAAAAAAARFGKKVE